METLKRFEDGLLVIFLSSAVNTTVWTLFLLHQFQS